MRRKGTYLLCLLMAFALCAGLLSMGNTASAAEVVDWNVCGDDLTWTLYDTGLLEITGTGAMYDYDNTSTYNKSPWYSYRSNIISLSLPEGLTNIGNDAFYDCTNLPCVSIPDSVTSIGKNAFKNCTGLSGDLVVGNGVTEIGSSAFYDCIGFTGSLVLPEGLSSIGDCAFYGCSGFTGGLVIPSGITAISDQAFWHCAGFTGNLVIPAGVTTIGSYAFSCCSGLNGTLTIPNGVTSIARDAFSNCSNLRGNLILPASVATIGAYAFQGCNRLTANLSLPGDLTSVGTDAFSGCYGAAGTLKKLGKCGDNLKYQWYSDGRLIITGTGDMYDYTVTNGFEYSSVSNAPWGSSSSPITSVTLPEGITSIGNYAFFRCALKNIAIPFGVTSIGKAAFYSGFYSSSAIVIIPESVTTIGEYAFDANPYKGNYSPRAIVIPDSVKSTGSYAFYSDTHLLKFHPAAPATCTAAGNSAYYSCTHCSNYYADAAAETSIASGSWVIPATGHTLAEHPAAAPTHDADGNSAYWSCEACERCFSDAEGKKLIADGSWVIPAAGHTLVEHPAVEPFCTSSGSSAYWSCSDCGKFFFDADGSNEVSFNSWVLPAAGHTLTGHPANAPTATADGNSAYWSCSKCGKYYADALCTKEIEADSWVLPALGNEGSDVDRDPTIAAAAASAIRGNTIEVSVELVNNPGIVSLLAEIRYDENALELVSVTDTGKLSTSYLEDDYTKNPYVLYWCDDTGSNCTGDGAIATLQFRVKDAAAFGSYSITVNILEARNYDMESVSFYTENGSVTVSAHILTEHEAADPTCTEAGNSAYWSCDDCDKFFADADAATEIEEGSWVIAATGHDLTEHKAVDATCTANGSSAYWSCDDCGKFFADAGAATEIEENSWVIPAAAHSLTEHKANDPTYFAEGNSAYWSCDECGKFFADANGVSEIEEDSWVLPALPKPAAILYGDVSADTFVNSKDNILLGRYLAGWTGYDALVDLEAADVNVDGLVNAKDNIILARHIAGWTGYETLPYLG